MKIVHAEVRPTKKAPAEWFTGGVWLDEIARGAEPSRVRMFHVTFAPGGRTAWHSHPLGQTLYVLSGCGVVQLTGEKAQRIVPGDTVAIAPGERHWHGAAPGRTMAHISLQEANEFGVDVVWMEYVTDEEYNA
jgi:quercetin dioxygenase-like cupin family protein